MEFREINKNGTLKKKKRLEVDGQLLSILMDEARSSEPWDEDSKLTEISVLFPVSRSHKVSLCKHMNFVLLVHV